MATIRVWLHRLWVGLILATLVGASFFAYAWNYYQSPGPLASEATVIFKKGEGFRAITDDLEASGVMEHPWLFQAIALWLGDARKFKAGEYHFSAAISPRLLMDMISEGRVVIHKLPVPEGLTARDVLELLRKEPALSGDLPESVKEGSLLPSTYHFTYGDSRRELLERMQTGMLATLTELWDKRKAGLPIDRPDQAVTLASIVEKETGVANERGRVAAVFINRLKRGMKLQSDPTAAYGVAQGAKLGRALTGGDLRAANPYNTYMINGLPPGPIANPGRAALEAVLNPPDTDELYFVATGTGGHHFSSTLAQHNEYVKEYREKMRGKGN